MKDYSKYSKPILRVGIGLVFLYFGFMSLFNPETFLGYLPSFLQEASFSHTLLFLHSLFEIILALFLILGIYVRFAALLLALNLAVIAFTLGFSQTGIRDMGLTIATIIIFLNGSDDWTLENKLSKK